MVNWQVVIFFTTCLLFSLALGTGYAILKMQIIKMSSKTFVTLKSQFQDILIRKYVGFL